MDISIVSEGATLLGSVMEPTVSILSPPIKTNLYEVVHVHVPMFLNRHVLVNFSVALTVVPSGTVISETNPARLHPGISVAVGRGVNVNVVV